MSKVLVVVDMQNDFINGSLGTEEAKGIVENVCNKITECEEKILVTLDTHPDNYLETFEGKDLPIEHCIKGTQGWILDNAVRDALKGHDYQLIEKPTFGTNQLASSIKMWTVKHKGDFEIEILGLCTDICVISNALMLRAAYPDVPITVYADCCAGTTPEKHEAALAVMESCQIKIV